MAINWIFLILILSLQAPQYLSRCSKGQYLADSYQGCQSQDIITANLRPTPQNFLFTLTFEGGQAPFTDIQHFIANTDINIILPEDPSLGIPVAYTAQSLKEDLTIIQVLLTPIEVSYGTTLMVIFTDFSNNETIPSYIKNTFISTEITPFKIFTGTISQMNDLFPNVDYVLEVAWIILIIFNPYWIMYKDSKLTQETLNLLKRVNVQYGPLVTSFLKTIDKKTTGVRGPNIFGMFLLRNNFASEWSRNSDSSDTFNSNRIDDLKILVNSKEHEFDWFPLFMDNYGVQLTLIIVCLIIATLCSGCIKMFNLKRNEKLFAKTVVAIKNIMFNFLLMTILGSYQSLSYYTGVQIQAFLSEKTIHNVRSFALASASFLLINICLFIVVAKTSKKRSERFNFNELLYAGGKVHKERRPLGYFTRILDFYRHDDTPLPMMSLLVVPKANIFTVLILVFNDYPIIQTAGMLGVTVLVMACLIRKSPFYRKLHLLFTLIYELIILATLSILLIFAICDHSNTYSSKQREMMGFGLVALWIAVPVATLVFAVTGYLRYYGQQRAKRRIVPLKGPSAEEVKREKKLSLKDKKMSVHLDKEEIKILEAQKKDHKIKEKRELEDKKWVEQRAAKLKRAEQKLKKFMVNKPEEETETTKGENTSRITPLTIANESYYNALIKDVDSQNVTPRSPYSPYTPDPKKETINTSSNISDLEATGNMDRSYTFSAFKSTERSNRVKAILKRQQTNF